MVLNNGDIVSVKDIEGNKLVGINGQPLKFELQEKTDASLIKYIAEEEYDGTEIDQKTGREVIVKKKRQYIFDVTTAQANVVVIDNMPTDVHNIAGGANTPVPDNKVEADGTANEQIKNVEQPSAPTVNAEPKTESTNEEVKILEEENTSVSTNKKRNR